MAKNNSTSTQLPLPIDHEIFEIPLTRGYTTAVDAIDADLIVVGWVASTPMKKHYSPYAVKTLPREQWIDGKKTLIRLHRVILERILGRKLERLEEADHEDNNPLNNRRSNLRLATHKDNMKNRRRNSNNTSGLKGVQKTQEENRWESRIVHDGIKEWLGSFSTKEEAYEAYCKATKLYHGEFANTGK